MKENIFKLSPLVICLMITGCAEYNRRVLEHTPTSGSPFTRTLAKEYETLGNIEQKIMYDECSANCYYCKAITSKNGYNVLPRTIKPYQFAEDEVIPPLIEARERLVRALRAGARERAPEATAHAQANFDCWVEQQVEGWQDADIARCKSGFHKAIEEVEATLMGKPHPHHDKKDQKK